MFRRACVAGTLLALAIAGCNKNDVPVGTAAQVVVRVFVDADGSGDASATDVVVPGTVTLTGTGGTTQQVTVDAAGKAIFDNVIPGSYRATIAVTPPSGAVLASAPELTVVVPFAGGEVTTQFRFVFNPGSVSGVLFRDDNGNGTFDAGIDTPAPGMTVNLFIGSDGTKPPIAVTTTNSAGQFTFNTLRPGPYTVEVKAIPTITLVGGDIIPVTVTAAATTTTTKTFTGNLLVPISGARAAAVGSTVAFEGVALANAGLVGTNQLYVQDANSGILVFGTATAGIVAGDVVRIIGVTALFNGELEVVAPGGGVLVVTKISSGTVPAPKLITPAQLVSGAFVGQLVKLQAIKPTTVPGTATTNYNIGFGTLPADIFQVRVASLTLVPIPLTFWIAGAPYDVTGVVGVFNGTMQVKPRSPTDVSVSNLNITTIAAAKLVVNDTVTVRGAVTATRGTFNVANAYIQDNTSGIQIFNLPLALSLSLGDSLIVHGKVAVFNGEAEITNNIAIVDSIKVLKVATGPIVAPKVITGAQFLSRTFEGQLITVQNVTINTVGNAGGTGTYTVTGTAPDGSPMTIFMSAPTGAVPPPAATFTAGSRYDLTGIAVPFGTPSVAEIKPRGAADVVFRP